MPRRMHHGRSLALAALLLALASAAYAQAPAGASDLAIDVPATVKELGLPKDKAEAATKALNELVGRVQESSKELVALLNPKKPELLLDARISDRIAQVQKAFTLNFEKFQLDLAEAAGAEKAAAVATRVRAAIPRILFEAAAPTSGAAAMPPMAMPGKKPAEVPLGSAPAAADGAAGAGMNLDLSVSTDPSAGSSGMGMMDMDGKPMDGGKDMMAMMSGMMDTMSGMMGMMSKMEDDPDGDMGGMGGMGGMGAGSASMGSGANSVNDQLLKQFQSANALVARMLSTLAEKADPASKAQLLLLGQLLANQTATLQILLDGQAKGSGGLMPSGSGMGGMGM